MTTTLYGRSHDEAFGSAVSVPELAITYLEQPEAWWDVLVAGEVVGMLSAPTKGQAKWVFTYGKSWHLDVLFESEYEARSWIVAQCDSLLAQRPAPDDGTPAEEIIGRFMRLFKQKLAVRPVEHGEIPPAGDVGTRAGTGENGDYDDWR